MKSLFYDLKLLGCYGRDKVTLYATLSVDQSVPRSISLHFVFQPARSESAVYTVLFSDVYHYQLFQ